MVAEVIDLFDSQSVIAALHANTAFKEAAKHLKVLTGTKNIDPIEKLAWMVVFQSSTNTQRIIDKIDEAIESIDCAGARAPDFWMTSDLAAIDKAKAIGLDIHPEWSIADLRYKLHQAIYGGDNG